MQKQRLNVILKQYALNDWVLRVGTAKAISLMWAIITPGDKPIMTMK